MIPLRVQTWGSVNYVEALARQKALVCEVAAGAADILVLCEHPVTITLGRTAQEKNIFAHGDELARRGIAVVPVDRGGDVTLHAPGQLVIYPIINLKRAGLGLRDYLRKLEQVAVDFLRDFDIVATGDDGNRGVWVGPRKIASVGVGVSRWVTYHGMGLNISTDLELFRLIRPCGLDVVMTSIQDLAGTAPEMSKAAEAFERHFQKVLECSS
jgi:lipoate-protein ligase B